jgi:hypothetical protein
MMGALSLPQRSRGRPSEAAQDRYRAELRWFCDAIREIRSTLDFTPTARGWCYLLESHGLEKGDFDKAERVINEARKEGDLPLSICAEDETRKTENLEKLDDPDIEFVADVYLASLRRLHEDYTPKSFWTDLDTYVEMTVEKLDLKALFGPICKAWRVPLACSRGWNDINSRAAMMKRFRAAEQEGKRIVLLVCTDLDPGGLSIADLLRSNMRDIRAVGWDPDNLIIDRFGLTEAFIERHKLTWIENLATASGGRLDDPRHPDHNKDYVQSYLARFGVRKCEANALVTKPTAARELCEDAILRYLPADAVDAFEADLADVREELRQEIANRINGGLA